jgi:mannose-6-phosphate isomerase
LIRVEGVPRHYPWGSPTAIPALLGRAPDGLPLAELWFGAHADAPSPVPEHAASLEQLIEADPPALLGTAVVERFGPRLPFLVKLLAAETALSIQVHPGREQAAAGFAAEEQRGIPRDAPERNYRDTNHKPELLCALSSFEALCGFRPIEQSLALVDVLQLPELAPLRSVLAGPDGLRAAFTELLTLEDSKAVVDAVVERASRTDEVADPAAADALAVVRQLARDFPGDIGIVLSLLLNHVMLAPGEAIFLDAGNVHAYLRGLGVEVMANSDNVLRCALTAKHVDVAEVLAVADFTRLADPRCPTSARGRGITYLTPVEDFRLQALDLDAHTGSAAVDSPGPHLVLCVEGAAKVSTTTEQLVLAPGDAAFVAAADGVGPAGFEVSGTGRVFAASVG